MIVSEFVEIKWNKRNKKIYEQKGYVFTGYRINLKVKFEDLTKGSEALIDLKCDNPYCDNTWTVVYYDYIRNQKRNKNQGDYCSNCIHIKIRKSQSLSLDFVKKVFEKRNYLLLDDHYINNKTFMNYVCLTHPYEIQSITYDNLRSGGSCHYCRYYKVSGKNHYNWQGGITNLNNFLRRQLTTWKFKSLEKANFRCSITGSRNNLEVHHIYSFNFIVKEIFIQLNLPIHSELSKYTEDEINQIGEKCLELHFKYGLGAVLTKEVHKKFHSIYGQKYNTPEQFEEFKNNYINNKISY